MTIERVTCGLGALQHKFKGHGMSPLVISFSQAVDLAELAEVVGPDLTAKRLPIVSKGLTGQEVALSIVLGIAGNAGYAGIKLGLGKLAAWLARATHRDPSTPHAVQITVSAGGTTVNVQGDANTKAVAILLEEWAQQADDPTDR